MKNETNLETIGTFEAEHQEPVANVEENAGLVVDGNDTNADLQGLINNRDALIREKRAAQDKATGFKTQLDEQTKANSELQQQIDDLLVGAMVNDIVSGINPVEGAKAFITDLVSKQVSVKIDDDGRRAQIDNDLLFDDLVKTIREGNKSIVCGVDSSGALNTPVKPSAKPTKTQFGLR